MGMVTGCWSLGLVIGPAIGGLLANPAILYPKYFGGVTIFIEFPYLLPNLLTSVFGFIALFFIIAYLPETLPPSKPEAESPNARGGASVAELIHTDGVLSGVTAYFFLSFVSIVYDEIVPLWAIASPEKGGLGMEQVSIGKIMSGTGVILLGYTFFLYPPCAELLGARMGYSLGLFSAAPLILITTLANLIPVESNWQLFLVIFIVSCTKMCIMLAFTSISLLLNDTVESDKRASMNGFSMAIGSLSKSIGPFLGAILLAWSINGNLPFPLDFHLMFVLISIIGVASAFIPLRSIRIIQQNNERKRENATGSLELTSAATSFVDTELAVSDEITRASATKAYDEATSARAAEQNESVKSSRGASVFSNWLLRGKNHDDAYEQVSTLELDVSRGGIGVGSNPNNQ